jgi:hypothetical protein
MEEDFIKQLKQDLKSKDFGSKQNECKIWYNKEGDCFQLKTRHDVAIIGKRIDEYLTLYVSVEDGKPIGFQLKDIKALIKEFKTDLMSVQADYVPADKSLVSITALMVRALIRMPSSINRTFGYTDALNTIVKEDEDRIRMPMSYSNT